MSEERTRRIAANEALFRVVNERIEDLNRAFATLTETMDVVCECGDLGCAERLLLSVGEYERVRADPTLFVVAPGHALPEVETVVETGDGFLVVRKDVGVGEEIARETDPRR